MLKKTKYCTFSSGEPIGLEHSTAESHHILTFTKGVIPELPLLYVYPLYHLKFNQSKSFKYLKL